MLFLHFTAGPDDARRRLDKIIRKFLPNAPLSAIYSYIRKSLVRVNGKKTDAAARVNEGDLIDIADFLLQPQPAELPSEPEPARSRPAAFPALDDVFCNDFLRVINKPYDIPVQGCRGARVSIADIVQAEYAETARASSLSFKPGPLHRLDRKTTGLLVCSRNLEGARWFSAAVRDHLLQKRYAAIVQGCLETERIWTDKIERETEGLHRFRRSLACRSGGSEGKTADTRAVPLAHGSYEGEPVTLVLFSIGSGRTHQIRLHGGAHGFPLLGDTAYGGRPISEAQSIYLHAWQLGIPEPNPVSLPPLLCAPISTNFQKMLKKCLLEWDYSAYNGSDI
ncbi:RluA family pseudouridine synthase [Treponema brennaborense]|uniref:Pseudouridine synthase n=1 Tax=Treponema brennaborense (strain DSM 12168 / CIP 105900 / DD5/3) TaxID=906968 RepID=F4LN45_TREBD|nr:RluA family pseudouridine synthase [Treponema brennaborense]AEE16810.1 pseudouridine synthase [Treponema brennaborense DSM 12168]